MPVALDERVSVLEERANDTDTALVTLTEKVNEVRLGNAKILKNLGVLMAAQGVPLVDLSEDETDAIFD